MVRVLVLRVPESWLLLVQSVAVAGGTRELAVPTAQAVVISRYDVDDTQMPYIQSGMCMFV